MNNLTEKMQALLEVQIYQWEQCRQGYAYLKDAGFKEYNCNTYNVIVQFNPGRIISSTAKVDSNSIRLRKCFLCKHNRPSQQQDIETVNGFVILCNPAPIFSSHFTISHIDHIPQSILEHFESILIISKELGPEITVTYNGPQSGASAPDHLHFQAFTSGIMPVESAVKENGRVESIRQGLGVVRMYDRTILVLQGDSSSMLCKDFANIYSSFAEVVTTGWNREPLLNLIVRYEENRWLVLVFLRKRHRPDYYFKQGKEQFIISPGAVDMGGLLIVPRREDFDRLTVGLIQDIYRQVSLEEEVFYKIIDGLRLLKKDCFG